MQTLRLLADDLTGALDSAAQFTGRLGPVQVYVDRRAMIAPGHGALDAATRDLSEPKAVVAMQRLGALLKATCAFKKIDSLLLGHWAAELAALLDTGRFRCAVLAPAFPVRAASHWVSRPHGGVQALAIDIVAKLRATGLIARRRPRPGSGPGAGTGTIVVADSGSDNDLAGVVACPPRRPRIHLDDTLVPVLAKLKARTRRLWTAVRDDRPFGGAYPPAAAYFYPADRSGSHAETRLGDYAGIVQADASSGFGRLYDPRRKTGAMIEAGCYAHARRKFFELADLQKAPIAIEAVARIDAIFAIERETHGRTPAERRATRRDR